MKSPTGCLYSILVRLTFIPVVRSSTGVVIVDKIGLFHNDTQTQN
jgi:hypothetical protein